ncbi:unnamed protein product [Nippostrongylus brasiliensis]|uniref:Acyl_transf_3 domain-containing protein n=1 Tax=Nippostrongylus brasiliensis TaxID=27835 RepID=A0A0N4Y473_NIPBR|nr:unnamed protein product [Nippostrongylus brasiliensis]
MTSPPQPHNMKAREEPRGPAGTTTKTKRRKRPEEERFFVLSGYLMSMMCEREKRFKTTEIVRFYFRRIKRIVPLYVVVMMGCVTISELKLFGHNDDTNWNAVRSAAAFATNIRSTNSVQGYLEMLHIGTDFYTHMWSISLEMQFYLIFPLLFFVYKHLWDELAQYYLAGIAMISLAYHVTLPSSRAFNLVHARIWQFVIGPLCIFWTPHFHRVLSVLSAVSCLWPYTVLPSLLLRIAATVLTAATILSYSSDNCTILTRKPLTYIGDISYALYLVHWPIYILVRQDFFDAFRCEVLTETEAFEHCIYSEKNYMRAVQEYKPDSLFILTRHVTLTLLPPSTTKRQIDEYASNGANALNRLAQAVADKVFVLNAADLFNKSSSFGVAREIVERAVANCPKCSTLDYVPTFTVNGTFRFFNPNTHILNLNGYWHFTSHGLNQLKPLFKEICRNITRRN